MSTPSPLLQPGVLEQASAPRSRVRITIFTILALHVVFIGGLLLQGCNREGGGTTAGGGTNGSNFVSALPPLTDADPDPDYFSSFPGDTVNTSTGSQPAEVPAYDPQDYSAQTGSTSAPQDYAVSPGYSTSTYGAGSSTSSTQGSSSYSVSGYDPGTTGTGSSSPSTSAPGFGTGTGTATGTGTTHTIQRGDTIGALAKRYGVSQSAIMDANPGVRPRALRVGDTLVIPAATERTSTSEPQRTVPPGAREYVVKRGDNLTVIARRFGVTVNQIREANGIRGDRILPDQRLIIPGGSGGTNGSGNRL